MTSPTEITLSLRNPRMTDGSRIWGLTKDSQNLDLNSPYSYLLLCRHFSDTCLVAEQDGDGSLKGFVTGYLPPDQPDTLFVWQVAVAADARRMGLGRRLVEGLLDRAIDRKGVRFLEATVTPDNDASRNLFKAIARDRQTGFVEADCFTEDLFPRDNGPPAHKPEVLLRVGPLGSPES